MTASTSPIHDAKQRLPLPQLLERLGFLDNARKKQSRCPFHEDRNPSFSVWQNDHGWHWKCHAGCGEGDEIDFLQRQEGLDNRAAIHRYLSLAGVETRHCSTLRPVLTVTPPPFDWEACVAALAADEMVALAEQRGYRRNLFLELKDFKFIGLHRGGIAFPVHDDTGAVIGAHYRRPDGSWRYTAGAGATPLTFGSSLAQARQVHVFESQWDAIAVLDRLELYATRGAVLFITRGASNGALVRGRFPKDAKIYAWPQNDADEKRDQQGRTPAEKWLEDVIEHCAGPVRVVRTPTAHKDVNDWIRAGGDAANLAQAVAVAQPHDPLRSLMDITPPAAEAGHTVLGDRFLCRGGAMIFVGPSGIGKSSASMQQDILWSLGREAFGIQPERPLRILTIQAENDDQDLAEMRDGVIRGLRLSEEEAALVRERVFYESESGRTGAEFIAWVEKRLAMGRFDLVRIDPLQAYTGGDVREPALLASFLRTGLGPVLQRQQLAGILNHHTPKTTHRDTSLWRNSDWMYAGAGGAEITNWARAIMVIDPTYLPHTYRFIAAKRGARIGWFDDGGEREFFRYFCHASDGLYWRAATPQDIAEAEEAAERARNRGVPESEAADLKALIPKTGSIGKNELLSKATKPPHKIGLNRARAFIGELLAAGEIFEHRLRRPGRKPEIRLSLQEEDLLRVAQEAEAGGGAE
jgi:hypothetical protein